MSPTKLAARSWSRRPGSSGARRAGRRPSRRSPPGRTRGGIAGAGAVGRRALGKHRDESPRRAARRRRPCRGRRRECFRDDEQRAEPRAIVPTMGQRLVSTLATKRAPPDAAQHLHVEPGDVVRDKRRRRRRGGSPRTRTAIAEAGGRFSERRRGGACRGARNAPGRGGEPDVEEAERVLRRGAPARMPSGRPQKVGAEPRRACASSDQDQDVGRRKSGSKAGGPQMRRPCSGIRGERRNRRRRPSGAAGDGVAGGGARHRCGLLCSRAGGR